MAKLNDNTIKLVTIKTYGPILMLGGILGPILKPFPVQVKVIRDLIVTKKEIYEIKKDGSEIKLDLNNYNTDNGGITKLNEYVVKKAEASQTEGKDQHNGESVSAGTQSKPASTAVQNATERQKNNVSK